MRSAAVYFDLADTADPTFDRPIEVMLVALLAFAPASLGAVQPWSEAIVVGLSLLMAATLALKLLRRPDVQFVPSWTYWLIAAFIALVGFQLLPLPAEIVRIISPRTFALRQSLLSDLPDAPQRLRWMTLSFYPDATLHDLRLIVALSCVFVVVINCIRRVSQVRRLLGIIALIAAVFAIQALVQDAFGTTYLYGLIKMPYDKLARSGPFINRGHFGQFSNLSIGAALGLGLILVNQNFRRRSYSTNEVKQKLNSTPMRPAWALLGIIVLTSAAVVLSLSRGAMLSAGLAAVVTCGYLVTRRGMHGRGWVMAAVLLGVACIAVLDYEKLEQRFTESFQIAGGNRLDILRDLTVAWKQFPIFGTGLGTHAVVFPMYDRSYLAQFASHAENEYAQLLTETGILGVAIAAAFLAIIIGALVRAVRGDMSPASSAAMGLMFGLIAILLHSFTDFGQHIPAVSILTAVTFAMILNLAQLRWRELGRVSTALPGRGWLYARSGALVVIILIAIWMTVEFNAAIRADAAWDDAQRIDAHLVSRKWNAGNAEYTDIITAAQRAESWRPGNVNYRYWLNYYRWKSITRALDPFTGLPVGIERYRPIIDELRAGRWLCPVFGRNFVLAYELENDLPDLAEQADRDIRRGYNLSGPDPTAALLLGQHEAVLGNVELADQHLRRAMKLDPQTSTDVMNAYLNLLHRPDLALAAAGDDVGSLDALADMLSKGATTQPLADAARQRAFEALLAKADGKDAPAYIIAKAATAQMQRKRYEESIRYFRRALALEYGEVNWRMKLAESLEALGRSDEALHEAEICLRRRSQMPEARAMVDRLTAKTARSTPQNSPQSATQTAPTSAPR